MWMKIIGFSILVIFLNCDGIRGHHYVEPAGNIKISKNITIHRDGHGRFLGLLKLLKGLHHKGHVYSPYVISRLWRASFEFEVNPRPIFEHEIPSNIYFPTDFGINTGGVVSTGKPSNSGLGKPSIDSIFHFGNNEQQSSVTIGGSNSITKGERDEIPIGQNHVINKEAIETLAVNDTITANDTVDEVTEKSERVLRHAIHARIDDESDGEETTISSTAVNVDEIETSDTSLPMPQTTMPTESLIPQTTDSVESLIPQTTSLDETLSYPSTVAPTDHQTVPSMRPEGSSTVANTEPSITTPRTPEWLGYYDYGIHRPEFIQRIEFTTNLPPQLVKDDNYYVSYAAPFKPSLPDYSSNAYPYSTNFFTALRYFKR